MARIFITGSADGLGRMAATDLIAQGHRVVLHARNEKRLQQALSLLPGAEGGVAGDLSSMKETAAVAQKVNGLGEFDAVIHNAGMGYRESDRKPTVDGLPTLFAVNSVAPYMLTALIQKPRRLIYLSSGLHMGGDPTLYDVTWEHRTWNGFQAYSDSKLHDLILSMAIARLWPGIFSNALEPGWVATKMGGPGATDNLDEGAKTQCWLATSEEPEAMVSGGYFYHLRPRRSLPAAARVDVQEKFLEICGEVTGVEMPRG